MAAVHGARAGVSENFTRGHGVRAGEVSIKCRGPERKSGSKLQ